MKSLEILTLLYFERASIPRGVALKEVVYSGVSVLDMLNFGNVRLDTLAPGFPRHASTNNSVDNEPGNCSYAAGASLHVTKLTETIKCKVVSKSVLRYNCLRW